MKDICIGYIKKKAHERRYSKKIYSIIINNKDILSKKLTSDQRREIKEFWQKVGIKPNDKWHRAYTSVNGIFDPAYIPEDLFYSLVIPKLGNVQLSKSYADKNMYDKYFPYVNKPKVIIRNIHGRYYDMNYSKVDKDTCKALILKEDGVFIIKPSIDSSQGKGVKKIKINTSGIYINLNYSWQNNSGLL